LDLFNLLALREYFSVVRGFNDTLPDRHITWPRRING